MRELGGASRCHLLKFFSEVLDFVGMIARNLLAERLFHFLLRSGRRNTQELVKVCQWHDGHVTRRMLFLEFGDIGGGQLAAQLARSAFVKPSGLPFDLGRARAIGAEVPAGLKRPPAVRTASKERRKSDRRLGPMRAIYHSTMALAPQT